MGDIATFDIYDMPVCHPLYDQMYDEISEVVFGRTPKYFKSSIGDLFPDTKPDHPDAIFHFQETLEEKVARLKSGYSYSEIAARWKIIDD